MQQGSESGGGGGGGKGGAIYDRFLVYHKKVRGRIIASILYILLLLGIYMCIIVYLLCRLYTLHTKVITYTTLNICYLHVYICIYT